MDLDHLRAFARVIETGSFSAAARDIGVQQSAVSRQVAALERRLGTPLLVRSTRTMAVTEAGQRYYAHIKAALAEIDQAEAQVRGGAGALSGPLCIAASVGFGRSVLLPVVETFLTAHPEVRIDLRLQDQFIDLIEHGIDIAVRIGELRDSALTVRHLCNSRRALLAARSYLDRRGRPMTPADIAGHDCILYSGRDEPDLWRIPQADGSTSTIRIAAGLTTNSSEVVRGAVCRGIGIAYAPTWLFQDELARGEVEILLPHAPATAVPISLLFPAGRRMPARVSAFADHLAACLGHEI